MNAHPAYGLWTLVLVNSALFLAFAFSFTRPRTARDWRSLGAFSAFIVALFVEMYGFPLTIYLLAGWIARRNPGIDPFSHDRGHLWSTLFGWEGSAHLSPLHVVSEALVIGGFVLVAAAWRVLHQAQRTGHLATAGPYARLRHPQYAGFILVMLGFLLQWPTLPTLAMFPVLVIMYLRLAAREEADARVAFGEQWERYAARVPRLIPRRRTGPATWLRFPDHGQ